VVEAQCCHCGSDSGVGFDDSVHGSARLRGAGHGTDIAGRLALNLTILQTGEKVMKLSAGRSRIGSDEEGRKGGIILWTIGRSHFFGHGFGQRLSEYLLVFLHQIFPSWHEWEPSC